MPAFSQHALLLERLGLTAALLALVFLLVRNDLAWRWDQAIYDAQIRLWSRPPPDDIVIVAIDAESIAQLGAWPWPRQIHAALLRKLGKAGSRAVLFDIIFAEASSPQADRALVDAIRGNGRIILPVLAEQARQGAPLGETLPLPALAAGAAGLGHTHIELDPDGMVRGVYLQAGLGRPAWPSFGLAGLRMIAPGRWNTLPGLRDPNPSPADPFTWVQDYRVLIPFLGPPGSFRRVSYARVLQGNIPAEVFRDKIVLVGATASGLGDALPTPVSGFGQAMPGVEIHATLIDALRRGLTVEPLPGAWHLGVSLALALLPALLFPYLSPRGTLLAAAGLLVLVAFASLALLAGLHVWFPPVSALFALAVSHPLWSWRRLEYAMRYLNRELQTLSQERTLLSLGKVPDIAKTLGFLGQVLPLAGWVLLAENGRSVEGAGMRPEPVPQGVKTLGWVRHQDGLWVRLRRGGEVHQLGLRWAGADLLTEAEQKLLDELARQFDESVEVVPCGTVERVEARIRQVQAATGRLRQMNQLVSDSLAEMADGVLIADALGRIVLANGSAESYLAHPAGRGLLEVLGEFLPEAVPLGPMLANVLLRQAPAQCYARIGQRDLMAQFAPLMLGTRPGGLIVNLTDITLFKASERRRLELLGFLSHDLRSPLVSMLALTELARTRPGQASEDFLGRVENHARAILGLADDFLNLIRAESKEDVPFRDVNLELIALNALDQVWPQADCKNIKLAEDIRAEEANCLGSAEWIERALVNLLTNAVKYSPPGTTVTLSLARRDAFIDCCVRDQGPGIAAEDLPYLFDAFRRAGGASQRAESGYGLGLAFVKVVAQRHGGEVSARSEPGAGACFCLSLPVA